MVEIPIPEAVGVAGMLFYLGLSTGWHIGKSMTKFNSRRKEGAEWSTLLVQFAWNASHHYDLGIAISTAGLAILLPAPTVIDGLALLSVGFGFGMAYDDRADHPPEGISRHILNSIRSSFGGGSA